MSIDEFDNIKQKIIKEIKDEVELSNGELSEDEIKLKIKQRIDKYFTVVEENKTEKQDNIEQTELNINNNNNNNNIEKKSFITDNEEIVSKYEDLEQRFQNLLLDFQQDQQLLENIQNKETVKNINNNINEDNNNSDELEQDEEGKGKKKFYLKNFKELYKEELNSSLQCFTSAIDCFLTSIKTSPVDLILFFFILIVPAALGGIFALLFLLLIILVWQIGIITKVLLNCFDTIGNGFKSTIDSLKSQIDIIKKKSSGFWGFFKKILFINFFYSIIIVNGLLYMLLKTGTIIPLKTILDAEKLIANILSKIGKSFSNTLRAPIELVLNSIGNSSLRSSKKTEITGKTIGANSKQTSKGQKLQSIGAVNKNNASNRNNTIRQQDAVLNKTSRNSQSSIRQIQKANKIMQTQLINNGQKKSFNEPFSEANKTLNPIKQLTGSVIAYNKNNNTFQVTQKDLDNLYNSIAAKFLFTPDYHKAHTNNEHRLEKHNSNSIDKKTIINNNENKQKSIENEILESIKKEIHNKKPLQQDDLPASDGYKNFVKHFAQHSNLNEDKKEETINGFSTTIFGSGSKNRHKAQETMLEKLGSEKTNDIFNKISKYVDLSGFDTKDDKAKYDKTEFKDNKIIFVVEEKNKNKSQFVVDLKSGKVVKEEFEHRKRKGRTADRSMQL